MFGAGCRDISENKYMRGVEIRMNSENSILSISGLTKKYGNFTALSDLSVELGHGIYGLLGANGAGKTTFLNLITDNISRTSGSILYKGTDILKLGSEYRKQVGYTPQVRGMYEDFTALEFLHYIGSLKGLKGKECRRQSDEFLQIVNLDKVAHKKIGTYSGGMKQRVLIACAMLGNPEILILDEPTVGLDPEERIHLHNYITEISRDRVIILATHVVDDIEGISRKVMLLNKGRLVSFKSPAEMIECLEGHVGAAYGTYEEMIALKEKYGNGKLLQSSEGFGLRIVADELPEQFEKVENGITLEDAYLYYL